MRTLDRNKQPVWCSMVDSKSEIIDEYGNSTGSSIINYTEPQKAMWSVSCVDADAEIQMFGIEAQNTVRIVVDKPEFTLDEAAILWIGKEPRGNFVPASPDYNYAIVGIRPSLNTVVIYARKVDVSA